MSRIVFRQTDPAPLMDEIQTTLVEQCPDADSYLEAVARRIATFMEANLAQLPCGGWLSSQLVLPTLASELGGAKELHKA
jgi:hypothetical protein